MFLPLAVSNFMSLLVNKLFITSLLLNFCNSFFIYSYLLSELNELRNILLNDLNKVSKFLSFNRLLNSSNLALLEFNI